MAGKTLIGGTVHTMSGGKAMIGGTTYKISKGKVLIGGTTYSINFGIPYPPTFENVAVSVSGGFNARLIYTFNGKLFATYADRMLYYSSDRGSTWTKITLSETAGASNIYTRETLYMAYGNNRYVLLVLTDDSESYYDYRTFYSTDGTTWSYGGVVTNLTRIQMSQPQRFDLRFINGYFVIANKNYVYYSTNGTSWSRSNVTGIDSGTSLGGYVEYINGTYVMANCYDSTHMEFATSTNLTSWTSRGRKTMDMGWMTKFNNKLYIFSRSTKKVYTSTDGITWSAGTSVSYPSSVSTVLRVSVSDNLLVFGSGSDSATFAGTTTTAYISQDGLSVSAIALPATSYAMSCANIDEEMGLFFKATTTGNFIRSVQ